jgi:hypothetical protein
MDKRIMVLFLAAREWVVVHRNKNLGSAACKDDEAKNTWRFDSYAIEQK